MKFGKTIKIFLIDGDPNGRMSCELSNWTGKAYKIPRTKLKDCSDRDDLKKPGVYLLFGKDEKGLEQVYIGEAESILKRIKQHFSLKEFWNEVIVLISKDGNLNKAHIKYLESRLYEIACKANRYQIENTSIPSESSISETDISEMEEFIENVIILVNALGHKVFDNKRETKSKSETFFLKTKKGADAQGEPTSDGFVVLSGSKAVLETTNSYPHSFIKLRQSLIDTGVLVIEGNVYTFSQHYIFNSPSTAASLVMARNANGLIEWRMKDGVNLKEYESNAMKNQKKL